MKDLKVIIFGIFAIVVTLALNFRHALNDYGVLDSKLHVEILAQSNSNGGNTTGGNTTSSGGNTTSSGGDTSGSNTGDWEGFKKGYTGKKATHPTFGSITCCMKSSNMNACNFNDEAWGCQYISREE